MQHTESNLKVHFSSEYGKFKFIVGNRQLNDGKIKRIIKDIEDGIDVLRYYPIQVVEKKERLEILDGQHRFYIAKKLKRPVHYIIMSESRELPDIAKINSNTEKWKTKDFINCYIEQGNTNYSKLQDFMDTYGFSATVSIKMLSQGTPGTEAGLSDGTYDFQRGAFEVLHESKAIEIANEVKRFSSFKFYKDRGFIIAIYRIKEAGKITIDELLSKYEKYPDMLQKQSGFKDYLFCLENIYNRGKQLRQVIY
jgi:hypothetical protein